eukprot:6450739-Pyramimonas_sp.AAC.1
MSRPRGLRPRGRGCGYVPGDTRRGASRLGVQGEACCGDEGPSRGPKGENEARVAVWAPFLLRADRPSLLGDGAVG